MAQQSGPRFTLTHAAVLAIAMFSAAALGEYLRPTERLAESKPKIDLAKQIPLRFGDWKEDTSTKPVLPNPELQARLDVLYSSTLARTYVNSKGQRIMLSIAYGSDQSSEATAVHRPEFCYSAQGFKVFNLGQSLAEIEGRKLAVQRLVGVLNQRREPITYWITLDETATLPGLGRKIEQIKYGLRGQIPDGLLFRISSIGRNDDEGFDLQQRFLRDLVSNIDPAIRSRYIGA